MAQGSNKEEAPPSAIETIQSTARLPAAASATEAAPVLDPVALTPHERAYLHTVAPLASRSPRAVKRFVNVYRLIRSSIASSEIADFTDEQHGDFRPALVLLATVVGVPFIAVDFLRHIERLDGASTLEELAATIRPNNSEHSTAVPEWIRLQCHFANIAAVSESMSVADLTRQIPRVGRFTFEYGRF